MKSFLVLLAAALAAPVPCAVASPSSPSDSLVYVMTTSQRPRFTQPWEKSPPQRKRGLGVVLENRRVLVTAELVSDATFVEFERPSNGEKQTARVVARDYESNLALLEGTDKDGAFLGGMKPVDLDGPARAGDAIDVWQLEDDGSPVVTSGTLARVETGPYFVPDRSFLRYEFKGSLQNKAGSFIIPAVREGKLTGLLLGYNANDQLADILPAPIIRRFLDDLSDGDYTGFPVLGIRVARTTDPQLRRWLKLADDANGVFIGKVEKGSSADKAGIKTGDVLLSLDGHALDRRGYYEDPEFGTLNFAHIVNGRHRVGDTLNAVIWRDGAPMDIPVKLERRNAEDYLVDPWVFDRAPRYVVVGGLVFAELSRPYLQSFKDWEKNAPVVLRHAESNQDEYAEGRRKLVILCYAIPTDANIGYERITSRIIKEVNGKPIGCIRDLHQALMKPVEGRHAITTTAPEDPVFYLDAALSEEVDQRLMRAGLAPLSRID
jgi:S1-C subfamily serine protease